ncbi:MAG: iron-containing redox enzyme family protein [Pseudobdellovibrionaceae bacterium]
MKQNEFMQKATEKIKILSQEVETMPWENVEFYNSWLTQTHAFVEKTSVFLAMCNERLSKDHPLKSQFEHHIKEEVGHEKMSENDMNFMKAENGRVFEITKSFWKTQYYWIKEIGPTAHLGYSLLLEGLAAKSGPAILKRVQNAGFNGYTFLKVHAEEDQHHFEDALKAVSMVTDIERDYIYQNLVEGMEMYLTILSHCESLAYEIKAA